jgi:tRNA uridine 5-carboxymethylaminomethyl modification enzyme
MEKVMEKRTQVTIIKNILNHIALEPEEINAYLHSVSSSQIQEKQKLVRLLLRPDISLHSLVDNVPRLKTALENIPSVTLEQAEIQIKYERYIAKEQEVVVKMNQMEDLLIPDQFNYDKISALSNEALQKFKKIKPRTLGQASRISGVNPSDVQILMVYMGR